jgi:hypothetical protein
MTGTHQAKGDRHERAVEAVLGPLLAPELLVERQTRAGYNRDTGDIHVLTADRQHRLATLQCKDWPQTQWRLPEWLGALDTQRAFARADHGVLVLKRARVLDAASAYALADLQGYARLLGEVARLRVRVAHLERDRRILSDRTYRKDLELDELRAP